MVSKIFANLSLKDLDKPMTFFEAVGFVQSAVYGQDRGLHGHGQAYLCSKNQIVGAHKTTEVLTAPRRRE